MHFDVVLLSCAIFVCWGLIGYSVVDQLGGHYTAARRCLLAPIAGLSVSTLLLNVVSRLGLPAKSYGWPLLGVLLAANLIYWLIRRPHVAWRAGALWGAVFFAALLLIGWPLIVAGTDWVSTGNGDMTNYLLGAKHFYEHAFYQLPSLNELLTEVDPSWDGSFQYNIGEVRSASQMVLAWLMAVTGLTAAQGYMILMAAFHVVVLSTSAALICSSRGREKVALAALVVIGSSANLALGMFIQLMPQDFGLATLAACTVVLLDRPPGGAALYRQGALGGIFLATLLIAYPELSPFVGLPVITYCGVALIRRQLDVRRWLVFMTTAGAAALACANVALPGALHFLLWNLAYSSHVIGNVNSLFPYYLTPVGLAQGWGFVFQGSGDLSSWQIQAYTLAGGLLFVLALLCSIRDAWHLETVAIVTTTMLLLVFPLFAIQNGFGLYKLAMYVQPFVLGALTIGAWKLLRGAGASPEVARAVMKNDGKLIARGAAAIVAIAFIVRNLVVIFQYGAATLDRVGSMTELPQWTSARVVSQIDALRGVGPKESIISTADNATIARFEGASLTGRPLLFVAPYMGPYNTEAGFNIDEKWASSLGRTAFRSSLKREIEAHNVPYRRLVLFKGQTANGSPYTDQFLLDPRLQRAVLDPDHSLLLESFNATLFNHWANPGTYTSDVTLKPYGAVRNLLVYVPSKRAEYNVPRPTMLFRFETDIFDRAKSMAGIGRYLLFQVVNPTKPFRMELNYTSSANADGENAIPLATVIGERTVRFPVAGHGAARLFSPPVAARIIDGVPFIALDMGRDGRAFPDHRRGIMTLYGMQYTVDYRRLVGFIRDISVVPDAAYRALRAPQALAAFPQGLEDPSLEFSGIYEDGWLGDQAVVWLSAPKRDSCVLELRAMVPSEAVARSLRISLAVDGRTVASILPAPGELNLQAAVNGDGRRHEIRIVATPTFHLPGGDDRPATVHLESVGFK